MVDTGLYTRVSTYEQAREGYSIRAQEEKLRAYAMLKEWRIFSVYSDEGISGKDIDGRPAIKQLIADVTSGKIKNVLVYKIDRLTRSTKNLIELVEIFNNHHCAFNSLQESIDTSSATGRMFLKIVGIFAEFERENLSERVRLGMERKVKEGYSLGIAKSSFGYNKEKGVKIQAVHEDEAAIVRRIYKMYLHDNLGYTQIAEVLNNEKIPTKYNKLWSATAITNMLSNPNYVGKVRYCLTDETRYFESDGQHTPIIDETTYYEVQEKIARIGKVSRTKHPTIGVYFCGVLYCNSCGSKYSTSWNTKQNKVSTSNTPAVYDIGVYRCKGGYGKKIFGKCVHNEHCNSKFISHSKVERAFEKYLANYEDLTVSDETQADTQQCDNSVEIAAMTAEVKLIEKKTEEVMSLFISNTIDFPTYQGMVKLSNERRGELEARLILLQNAQAENTITCTTADIIANFRENWTALGNEQRQQFVQKFIKKMTIHRESNSGKWKGEVVIDEIIFNEF